MISAIYLDFHECCNFIMLFVFIYVYCCPTQIPFHMMLVSSSHMTTGVTCRTGISYHFGVP